MNSAIREKNSMENLYNEVDAKALIKQYPEIAEELVQRTYTARLIGKNPTLVLHSGTSFSLKFKQKNVLGENQQILFIRDSGVGLANIEPADFMALDLAFLKKFRRLDNFDDAESENQLKISKLQPSTLDPPIDCFLHAFLPHRYVDCTQADSILILTNQPDSKNLIKVALGPDVVVLPYTKSGLLLAQNVAEQCEKNPGLAAIVIANYGIITFGKNAQMSYSKMIDCVDRAEAFLANRTQNKPLVTAQIELTSPKERQTKAAVFAQLIRGICAHENTMGRLSRFRVEIRNTPELLEASFAEEAQYVCSTGVLTPIHVIPTKNKYLYIGSLPDQSEALRAMLSREIDKFIEEYRFYFQEHTKMNGLDQIELDPYPRVLLAKGLGLFTLGYCHQEAKIAADIAEITIRAKFKANVLGQYIPVSGSHVFNVEYGILQQKKSFNHSIPLLQGQIALITGGGGAIGFGIADRLLAAGAAVVLSDIDESRLHQVFNNLKNRYPEGDMELITCDVSDFKSVVSAYSKICRQLGGIDIVVPNAGIAHVDKIENLEPIKLDKIIDVNLKGTFNTIKAAIPIFRKQGTGGNVIVISSKNVFDPGAAFGAYSATKAGAHQIAKIAALELAQLGVRVNMVNPDAVFGDEIISSKLWDLIGPDRMKSRGLDFKGLKEYYRNRNLLKTEVKAEHVGNAVVFFASNQTPTTGTSLPVDGGIPAAFPR